MPMQPEPYRRQRDLARLVRDLAELIAHQSGQLHARASDAEPAPIPSTDFLTALTDLQQGFQLLARNAAAVENELGRLTGSA
ncbi:MAG: hypothetical protein ACE5K7_00285 [Phycisphaerae bacterium]